MQLSRLFYHFLTSGGIPQLVRSLLDAAPVFCLHNVVANGEDGQGDCSLHMALDDFEEFVGWARTRYEFVTLEELTRRMHSRASLRGLAALTFDDALQGVLDHALPVLHRHGVPCTLFVVTSFATNPQYTWWDLLAHRGVLSDATRSRAIGEGRGLASSVLPETSGHNDAELLPPAMLPASWQAILSAVGDAVGIGSHTLRHPNLLALSPPELHVEFEGSRVAIGERLGILPEVVAYPYGLVSPTVAAAARRAGYSFGFGLDPRPVRATRHDRFDLPRVNVPASISLEALECWSVGANPRRWF